MSTPPEWTEPDLTESEKAQRRQLEACIDVGQRFERFLAELTPPSTDDEAVVRTVVHGLVVQGIHLSRGILRLHESPTALNLVRSLCECDINLRYIVCDTAETVQRARNFHEFFDVSKIKILREIQKRVPAAKKMLDEAALLAQIQAFKPRFFHPKDETDENSDGKWDWDERDVVGRAEVVDKVLAKANNGERGSFSRIVTLYQEANPSVHGGMYAVAQVFETHPPKPRMRLLSAGRMLTVLSGHALLDCLETVRRFIRVDDFAEEIARASRESLLLTELKPQQ